jgi:carbon catabolite-derepressing protein kinase
MLVVDPLKRITIPEIRKMKWFEENLPAYLHPLPDRQGQDLLFDDPVIISALIQVSI